MPVINNEQFAILFQFYSYNRPSIVNPPTLFNIGSVALPLPAQLQDRLQLGYSEEGSGPTVGAALEQATALISSGNSISEIVGNIVKNASGIGDALLAGAADTAATSVVNAAGNLTGTSNVAGKLLQLAGVAQNPFLTILFNAPVFKRHIFTWTFIPETINDSTVLKFITNKFRYHSLPNLSSYTGKTGLLLTYPDMCVPLLLPSGFMYDMKTCVIESVIINYAPGDTPAFFPKSNAPNTIQMTLSLLEIAYWLKGDLTNDTPWSKVFPYGS